MNRNVMLAAAMALLMVAGLAHASIPQPAKSLAAAQKTRASAKSLIVQGLVELQNHDLKDARAHLEQAIDAPDFVLLPSDYRYAGLFAAGMLENQRKDFQKAHALLVRASRYTQADATPWLQRLFSAATIQDYTDAARALTVVAKRWPGQLDNVMPSAAGMLHHQLQAAHKDTIDRKMLDALFDAGWPGKSDGMDFLWKDLALIHIRRGDLARATRIALRVRTPADVMGMRVDKRFDPITRKHPHAFDIKQALAARIKQFRALWKAHPDRLQDLVGLQHAYLSAGEFSRVLAISDAVVAKAESGDGAKAYSDFGKEYNWVLDYRARALTDQGHWHAAVRERLRAARVPEYGSLNVSQAINLGDMYADLGEPDKAADAISQIGPMSPYGRMQLEEVKLRIAIDRKDPRAIARHMAYLRTHREDAMNTWQNALLVHGDMDKAAALLIERLRDPNQRSQALAEIQHFLPVRFTPLAQRIEDRRHAISSRPDVLAALHKVGRVENVPITPLAY